MDNLKSPTNGDVRGSALFEQADDNQDEDIGPHDALIRVKFYFYGDTKALRESTFPTDQ
jgi:hypothetical protein